MKYDFTSILERKGKDAIAVDGLGKMQGIAPLPPKEGFDLIPMWVADMNFPVCPSVREAIEQRLDHPVYGYFSPRQEYFDSIINWQEKRNGVANLKAEHIGYENGVLGGVISALNVLASKGDKVLLHSPTYIGFTQSLKNNGYEAVRSPLVLDDKGIWRMDFEDMERKIVKNHIHVALFCSPHNPTGRVWEEWELKRAMELFEKHKVYLISDEIWSDIILKGNLHIPSQSVNAWAREHTLAFYAPTKTFNLAGLVGSYHIVYNEWLRDRIRKESSLCHYNTMNVLSMYALIGAYKEEGQLWTQELCRVIEQNVDWACRFIDSHLPGVTVSKPQGTYMLFVDFKDWLRQQDKSLDELERSCWDVGLAVQDGRMFFGDTHLRMNLALPFSRVKEAFERMEKYVFSTCS